MQCAEVKFECAQGVHAPVVRGVAAAASVLGTAKALLCVWYWLECCHLRQCLATVTALFVCVHPFLFQRYESRVAELEDMVARQSEVGSLCYSDEEEENQYGTSFGLSVLELHVCVCVCVCVCVNMCYCRAAEDLAESEIGLARKVVSKWKRFRHTSVVVSPTIAHLRQIHNRPY